MKKKKKSEFLSENFQFLVVKFSNYLNRRVFVMLVLLYNTSVFCALRIYMTSAYVCIYCAVRCSPFSKQSTDTSRKHAYIILTPLNPT